MEPGTPLSDALGGMTVERAGMNLCGNVLGACGFEVREAGGDGVMPSPSSKPIPRTPAPFI